MDCGVAVVVVDSAFDKFYLLMLTIIMNNESIEFLRKLTNILHGILSPKFQYKKEVDCRGGGCAFLQSGTYFYHEYEYHNTCFYTNIVTQAPVKG